jgi:hypothetical protein
MQSDITPNAQRNARLLNENAQKIANVDRDARRREVQGSRTHSRRGPKAGKAVLGRYVAGGGCGDLRAKSTLYDVLGTRFLQAQPLSSPQPLGLLLLIGWGNTQARVYQRSKRASEIVLESN